MNNALATMDTEYPNGDLMQKWRDEAVRQQVHEKAIGWHLIRRAVEWERAKRAPYCRCTRTTGWTEDDNKLPLCNVCGMVCQEEVKDRTRDHAAQGESPTVRIGSCGQAYDGPEVCRAYTYKHQPGNQTAYRLGGVTQRAKHAIGGDNIDFGLSLLKLLEDAGFGVFDLKAVDAAPVAQGAGPRPGPLSWANPPLVDPDLTAALKRFNETTEDDESYDVPADMMDKLAAWGVVRKLRGSVYQTTLLGDWILRCTRSASAPVAAPQSTFQARVQPWMLECFGPEIAADKIERNHRFLEESLELVQSLGCTKSEAHQLVDYVYGRPQGDVNQEVGGVMVTLAALCLASGLDMHVAGETELARIWTKVEQIRAKQATKPRHSPLPGFTHPHTGNMAQRYNYKRYRDGKEMAEGVGVHAFTRTEADIRAAEQLARHYPKTDYLEFSGIWPCTAGNPCSICPPSQRPAPAGIDSEGGSHD